MRGLETRRATRTTETSAGLELESFDPPAGDRYARW